MKIAIGSDHAGYELKEYLKTVLEKLNHEVIDVGTDSLSSCDYPVYGFKVGETINEGSATFGVVVCGSGIGISIAANKVKGIRCANVFCNEHAKLCRQHNNANVIAFGARFIGKEQAEEMLKIFLDTPFEGDRHLKRVELLDKYIK